MKGLHIGIIPDGSRRWARRNNVNNFNGDQSGMVAESVMIHAFEKYPQIEEISIWAVSTENLSRPDEQKRDVYALLEKKLKDLMKSPVIFDKKVRVNVVGSRFGEVPENLRNVAKKVVDLTKDHDKRKLNVCIGYGGKQEIFDAVMSASKWLRKNPTIAKLHENVFENYLMVPRSLDVVIRTGGEKRLSGFMLYQTEYAELFFTDTLWPDFSTKEFDRIMEEFMERDRRYGK
jgi:undecaprenyl diphosphate synthase